MQPSTVSSAPANRSNQLFKWGALAAAVVLLGLVVFCVVVEQKHAKEAQQQSQRLAERVAKLEAEDTFVESEIMKERYQAVFLTNGQVYFGKITKLTKDTMKIEGIYYLDKASTSDSNTFPSDANLVKLGKELHGPEDAMILERNQVTFWENLKPDGEVSKAIVEFKKSL